MSEGLMDLDWARLGRDLDRQGWAMAPALSSMECAASIALWSDQSRFRKTVVMERHGFGQGIYKYWGYPLPPKIAAMRSTLYAALVPLAEQWRLRLNAPGEPFPATHSDYLARCHAAGQVLPTPLLLRYEQDGYNCLHQDLYGPHVFPLQAAILLSRPDEDFSGGEFVLVEQRPRAQSRVEIVPLRQGDMVVFAVNHRPAPGSRGWYRMSLRHGVSRIRGGERFTLGIILHDAES
jgi:hypothetical protein